VDVGTYVDVARRHRRVLAWAFAVALALMLWSAFKITTSPLGLQWKLLPTYEAGTRVFVTQGGFPWGRSTLVEPDSPRDPSGAPISEFGDPSRFEYLAVLYAQLAESDLVKQSVLRDGGSQKGNLLILDGGKTVGKYTATAVTAPDGSRSLPLVQISAVATSEREAKTIASRVTNSLRNYIASSQSGAGIKGKEKVELRVVNDAVAAKRIKGRPIVLPIAIFFLTMLAALGVILFRENLRRAVPAFEADDAVGRGRMRLTPRPPDDDTEPAEAQAAVAAVPSAANRWTRRSAGSSASRRPSDST
jgi:hypothetical protein